MSSGATRVAIPSSVKKTIDDIKEITGQNHGDNEIYAMLKECSMDPNETAQKLLLLDAFHEVKKRRDRRRENLNKEPAQLRWRQGGQPQVNRAGRENYSYRPTHDAGGRRNSFAAKDNCISHFPLPEKVVGNATMGNTQKIKNSEASSVSSPITDISDCPSGITSQSTDSNKNNNAWASGSLNKYNGTKNSSMSKLEGSLPLSSPAYSNKSVGSPGSRNIRQNEMLDDSDVVVSLPSVSTSESQFSSLDPLLSPSQDISHHSALDTIKSDVGSNHILVKQNADNPASDDNIRPQVIVPQKVSPGKEWKPKSTNSSISQVVSTAASSEGSALSSEKAATEIRRILEELHISSTQQVVLPNHVHVAEAGKLGFSFGSFDDACFGPEMTRDGSLRSDSLGSDKSTPLSVSSDSIGEPTEVPQLSNPTVSVAGENAEIKYSDHTHSHPQEPEDFSPEDYGEGKHEVAPQCHQHPNVHTPSSYNYGYPPPMLNGQPRPSENPEAQACGALPGFLLQQSFDPMSYYAQLNRSGMESDGRLNSAGAANNYNGNAGLISAQPSQSPQEANGPLFVSTASPAVPIVTQAAGVMQSSISANQQQLPVFHQPAAIHLPPYPPFIPYAPYFSPVYVPPHAIHQFFSSGAFPQQPHSGNLYPNPHETTATYSIPQNNQGSSAPNSNYVGAPVSYVPYNVPLANHTSNSVTEALNSTSNEEVQENYMYANASEQQTEGARVSQGQVAFAPTQHTQGPYTTVFHHAHPIMLQQPQPVSIPINMVGPTAGVYPPQPQQQLTQFNWPSNC